jgi:aconitate hydratase
VFSGKVMIKTGDNITTDHIMPAGAKILPYRSNIEKISEFCFSQIDEGFPARCKENGGGFIVGGENYGQGSSREHAALAPMYLGIKAVIVKSYARIHKQNLINSGIFPFTFADPADADDVDLLDELEIAGIDGLKPGEGLALVNKTKGRQYAINGGFSERELTILKAGGLLNTMG